MTSFANMPVFFGRATIVLGEHAELHVTLDRLREWCLEGRKQPESPAVQVLLQEFLAQLGSHFAAEEDASYFGTLLSAFPASRDTIEQLCRDHARFLNAARTLHARAAEASPPPEFAQALSALLDELAVHERAESLLLRRYFSEAE